MKSVKLNEGPPIVKNYNERHLRMGDGHCWCHEEEFLNPHVPIQQCPSPTLNSKNVRVLEKGALADNYVQNLYTKKHNLAKKTRLYK